MSTSGARKVGWTLTTQTNMTPRQFDWLKWSAIIFSIGVAWATTVGAVNRKVDKDDFAIYQAAQHDTAAQIKAALSVQTSSTDQKFKDIDNFIGSFCIGVRDPQIRYLRQCDRRGIK